MARDKQSKMSRDNPASNLRTLRVTFFGPFGFCLYGRGSDRHFDVHVPQLTGHEYWVGSPRKTETILDPLPEGRGQLDNVDQVMKVKLPSSELALVLDSNDDDTKIVGIGKTRNTFCFPLPSAILLNSIYSVNNIFNSKSRKGPAKRLNNHQKFVADQVSFVYSLSKRQVPEFTIPSRDPQQPKGKYRWIPGDPNADSADLHFTIGPAALSEDDDNPDTDFDQLVKLFPNLDLAAKGMPLQYRVMHPPYTCRAASMFVMNAPTIQGQ